jgi:hypothetical protein
LSFPRAFQSSASRLRERNPEFGGRATGSG